MVIVYSFIGKLPDYIVDTVYQSRLFFDGEIYLILDDFDSPFLKKLNEYNVRYVPYNDVKSEDFLNCSLHRFKTIHDLKDRKMLFCRAMERFFLLQNLMRSKDLTNVLFLELDNLIYNDPKLWENALEKYELTFMYDNDERIATGICFVKSNTSLDTLTQYYIGYIDHSDGYEGYLCEMDANWKLKENIDGLGMLPIFWKSYLNRPLVASNFGEFGNSIFDASSLGIYLLGMDTCHTGGEIKKGLKNPFSLINYNPYKIVWESEDGFKKPFIYTEKNERLLINNLHAHSKFLKPGLSK